MSLEMADRISNAVIKIASVNGMPPIVVTVVDPSGEIIVTKRMDGSTPAFAKFAYAKAWTAACFKISTRAFRDKYTPPGKEQFADKYCQMMSMVNITGGNMAPFPGGVVVKLPSNDGGYHIIGGVGVSGASSDEDEYCALAGIHESSSSYITEPLEPVSLTK